MKKSPAKTPNKDKARIAQLEKDLKESQNKAACAEMKAFRMKIILEEMRRGVDEHYIKALMHYQAESPIGAFTWSGGFSIPNGPTTEQIWVKK